MVAGQVLDLRPNFVVPGWESELDNVDLTDRHTVTGVLVDQRFVERDLCPIVGNPKQQIIGTRGGEGEVASGVKHADRIR